MNVYENLIVWKMAMQLLTDIYDLTNKFPSIEKYCLTSQMRRAAISIPSNIAEGAGRFTKKDFNNFLSFSTGSCCEIETQLLIAKNLKYITDENYMHTRKQVKIIKNMLFKLHQSNIYKPNT